MLVGTPKRYQSWYQKRMFFYPLKDTTGTPRPFGIRVPPPSPLLHKMTPVSYNAYTLYSKMASILVFFCLRAN